MASPLKLRAEPNVRPIILNGEPYDAYETAGAARHPGCRRGGLGANGNDSDAKNGAGCHAGEGKDDRLLLSRLAVLLSRLTVLR